MVGPDGGGQNEMPKSAQTAVIRAAFEEARQEKKRGEKPPGVVSTNMTTQLEGYVKSGDMSSNIVLRALKGIGAILFPPKK